MLSAEESAAAGGEFVAVESTVGAIPAVPSDFDPLARTL